MEAVTPETDRGRFVVDERLDVLCWCERRVLRVRAEIVRAGETRACGHADCCPAIVWQNPDRPGGTLR